ncbi:hypothetical protein ACFPIJ_32520 [Dactylosporangium cerinum]|uniref:Uncharacterized protein n=1 Tax=Dactylosporangium cerinum TaxID=1434730 RepID=A0ABV9W1P9_9ACTN
MPSTGRFLDAIAADDSQLHDWDRQAIRDGMRVLLQLGQSATLAYDAQHGLTDEEVLEQARANQQGDEGSARRTAQSAAGGEP